MGAAGVGAAWTVGKEAAIAAAMVAIVGGRDGVREKDCADFAFSKQNFLPRLPSAAQPQPGVPGYSGLDSFSPTTTIPSGTTFTAFRLSTYLSVQEQGTPKGPKRAPIADRPKN